MFETLRNAWKIPDLRKKILFTLAMLIVFRLGSFITVPFLRPEVLKELASGQGNSLFGYIDILTGGAFSQATIFAMSITPYINASIIMQLLTVAIPKLEQLSKEGEEGRKVIAQWIRYATVVLGALQATALYFGLSSAVVNPGLMSYITIMLTFTAGTAFLMWLGEQITESGIGNGISMLIFAGIVSSAPAGITALINLSRGGALSIVGVAGIILVTAGVIVGVVWVQQAERRIPVQYAKRVVGRKMYGGQSTHLPLKVNQAGVIPIIFASSITMFPSIVLGFIFPNNTGNWLIEALKDSTQGSSWLYTLVYALFIVFFTFFYTVIQFNPVEISNNMKKNGGFIPGLRPGKPTADYISKVLNRITWFGALFLALLAIFPSLMAMVTRTDFNLWFAGTAVLILVGVAMDTVKQIESQMLMRHYKGFLE